MSTAEITLATGMITTMIATSPVARRYASNNRRRQHVTKS